MDGWSRDSGAEITSIMPQWKNDATNYLTLDCRVETAGDLNALSKFIYDIEKGPMMVRLDSVELSAHDNTGQQHDARRGDQRPGPAQQRQKMKTHLNSSFKACLLLALVLAAAALPARAQSNGIPGPQDYERFSHFITDRNIFDPNRVPHDYNPDPELCASHAPPRATPGIQLVGTMSYGKGLFAFFSGNSEDLSSMLRVGGKIPDYTITESPPSRWSWKRRTRRSSPS